MAKISTYPIISVPTLNDLLIGTDVENLNETKNFSLGDISGLIGQGFVPYVGATGNVNLGAFSITASSFIIPGGLATQFVKADGSLDSTAYTPQTRTLTINGVTYNLSANRSWDLNTIDTLTTTGTSGAATYVGKTLNIPVYQAQGAYITQLSGEATAVGPGNATVTLDNAAVIGKILSGLNVTGGTVVSTDTILQAFGKVQNQINALAGGVEYQGVWNAATNNPFLQSSVGVQGYYYVVNVAGNTNLNGITDWQVGDWAIFNGSTWDKVDNTDAVVSVNGYVGAVVLTASDVGAVPTTRTLTINGVGYDLSADRSWTVGDVRTDQTYANPSWITSLAWTKITGTPTTLAGYGITDGALNTTTLTINGVTFDLTANRTWNVGTVTSIATTGPITGGTITGSGTIGITQAGASSDGYLSSTDWNTFNGKQGAISVTAPLTFVAGVVGITQSGAATDGYLSSVDWNTFNNKVSGSGTPNTLPMWGSSTSLINSPLSYAADTFNFQYNSATGGTVNFTNIGLSTYTYSIQMNNFGSPRSTIHSYTDGLVIQSIGGTQVSRIFANGNMILGTGTVETGHKLTISGDLFVNTIINAVLDTDRFIVSDGGIIKYRTGAEVLADIGAQGSLTLTTTGTSGASTLIGNTLNIPQYTDQFVGTVTSVGLSMPLAFNVSNSPITSSGTIAVTGAGTASQYVRGDGTLADFPSGGGGGGSSVSYYLNGSVNQGTFVGNTYYEMNKTPIFGAGTDFSVSSDGYIAQFITDAGDPNSLLIPAGNWNFETYFNASSSGGTPSFYVELYKYDGTTFTLIASNSANPEFIAFGTIVNPYFSALAVPETILTITDRLAVRIYVATSGRTITLHTENSNLCQVITTFSRGVTALNGLTEQVQYFQVGTSGTDFNISSATATHTFNLPTASAVNRGALSSADWAIFNGKQNAITLTTTGTSGVSTLVGSTLNIPNYSTDLSGYVTLATDQTITGLKTIQRVGAAIDVLNFKIGTDTLYAMKIAYNQNELAPSGEATWSFASTFNNGSGTGLTTTPISFFRGVLVTGQRLVSASVNTNILDYYGNNPSGRYPIYAYNTGVQQFASSIIVGETTGVVDAITGAIADLPAGVVANFKGRVIGSNAVNNNEFATLGQVTSTSRTAISLTTTGTSGPATYSNVTGILNIPEYQGGVTSFNTRTGAVTLTSSDVTTALGYTPVTDARTLTINGVTYDLTANRTWTVGVNPSAREIQTYIATSGQTVFTVTGGYTVGLVDVFINGVRLTSSDYTATNGTTVVLTVGTMVGNIVDIIKYTSGIVNSISGTGTTNELAYFTGSTVIASLSTATYPSLTELSYVKGVTSSIQTQLNAKQAAGTYVTSVTASSPLFSSGGTTPNITIQQASGSQSGFLSSTDWTTFNSKQNALTNPVTGTGDNNYIAKFTSTGSTIGNSQIFDTGSEVRIFTTSTDARNFTLGVYGVTWDNTLFEIANSVSVFNKTDSDNGDIIGFRTVGLQRGDIRASATSFTISSRTDLILGSNNTEAMRIFAGGNTHIGPTPSSDNGAKLQVSGTASIGSSTYKLLSISDAGGAGWATTGGASTSPQVYLFSTGTSALVQTYINSVSKLEVSNAGISVNGSGIFNSDFVANETSKVGISFASGYGQINSWGANTSTYGGLKFQLSVSNGSTFNALTLAPSGAATFSGDVSITKDNPKLILYDNSGGSQNNYSISSNFGFFNLNDETASGVSVMSYGGGLFNFTGASTFSSSVTATQFITGGTPSNTAGFTNSFYAEGSVPSLTLSNTGLNTGKYTFGVTNGNLGIWNNATSTYPMFITSGGSVGINNTSPVNTAWGNETNTKQLSIDATNYAVINLQGSTGRKYSMGVGDGNYYMCYDNTAGRHNITVSSGGNVLIGTTIENGARLQVSGGIIQCLDVYNNTTAAAANMQIDANGFFARSTSSIKYKKNVKDYTKGLIEVMQLRPVLYEGKSESDKGKIYAGLIAEEIHELGLTEFVQYAEDGTPDALSYSNMVALLVKAIQELQAKLDKNNIN